MIPKIIHQTWVGDKWKRPDKWMETWKQKNPEWKYMLWNEKTAKELDIKTPLYEIFLERKLYQGVADIIRYHALYKYGGVQPGADSLCLEPIEELFTNEYDLYTFACTGDFKEWENVNDPEDEEVPPFLSPKKNMFTGLVSPIHASTPGHPFIKKLIDGLLKKEKTGHPWMITGNGYCREMIEKHKPRIKIYPMHYFIPYRRARTKPSKEYRYIGKDKVYSYHFWGTTNKKYEDK